MKSKIQVLKEEILKALILLLILVPILGLFVVQISPNNMYSSDVELAELYITAYNTEVVKVNESVSEIDNIGLYIQPILEINTNAIIKDKDGNEIDKITWNTAKNKENEFVIDKEFHKIEYTLTFDTEVVKLESTDYVPEKGFEYEDVSGEDIKNLMNVENGSIESCEVLKAGKSYKLVVKKNDGQDYIKLFYNTENFMSCKIYSKSVVLAEQDWRGYSKVEIKNEDIASKIEALKITDFKLANISNLYGVRVDTTAPTINDVIINGSSIEVEAEDDNGIAEYAITLEKYEESEYDKIEWQDSNEFDLSKIESETYYVWVKDIVGNINVEKMGLPEIPIFDENTNKDFGKVEFYIVPNGEEDEKYKIETLEDRYLKINDILMAKVIMNDYLYKGLENGEEQRISNSPDEDKVDETMYPLLTIGEEKFTPVSAVQESGNGTVLEYIYKQTDKEKQQEVLNPTITIDFNKNMAGEPLYVYYSEEYDVGFSSRERITNIESRKIKINIDGIPYLNSDAYVEDKTATGKYTEGTEVFIQVTSSEKLKELISNPEIEVSFSESGLGKYNYQEDKTKGNAKLENTETNENGYTVWTYSYIIQPGDEGLINIEYVSGEIKDNSENVVIFYENEDGQKMSCCNGKIEEAIVQKPEEIESVYADTTAPTVKITPNKITGEKIENSITNENKIRYTITFSEEVIGFTADDIIVNGGTKGELSEVIKNEDGTYSYTIDVTTNVGEGNYEKVQVIIEYGVCKDLVEKSNIRTENTVIIDKKAPLYVSTEVVGEDKEYYKPGDKLTIMAVFDENVSNTETLPNVEIAFSDTGIGKGTLSEGKIFGSIIKWEYEISEQDDGTLVIKKLAGTVSDFAGNESVVNKKNLEYSGIIVDNEKPIGTISYDKTEITNENVTATISFNEDVIITNNNGETSYTFTQNGEFTFEFEDMAGNTGTAKAEVTIIDKIVPEGYTTTKINKDGTVTATITFSEEEVIITNNNGKNTYTFTKNGEFIFEFKDKAGNENTAKVTVDNISEGEILDQPQEGEIVFKELTTKEVDGTNHVIVKPGMTKEEIQAKIDSTKLAGQTASITGLTEEGKVKTGSEVKLNGETKYIIVVKGDINCDGEVEFIGDVIQANNYRLKIIKLNTMQKLAADIDNNGTIDFISDIIAMNNYRLGIISSL